MGLKRELNNSTLFYILDQRFSNCGFRGCLTCVTKIARTYLHGKSLLFRRD